MNTAVGIGIGIAYGTRVTGNYNPGFSLTAPVLAFVSATDPDSDNTQDLTADIVGALGSNVVRLVGTFGSATVSEPYDIDEDGTDGDADLIIPYTTGAIDDGVCSFKCRIEDGLGNALSDWSNTVSKTIDATAATITSSATANNAENSVLAHSLTANESVTWALNGGADVALFEISGSTLRWASNGTQDYETPLDAGGNNVYNVTVRATDTAGNTTDQNIAVTVTDVAEGYSPPGTVFDGTNDYLSRGAGLTGASDAGKILISMWVKVNGGDGSYQEILEDDTFQQQISRQDNNKLKFQFCNSGNSPIAGATLTTSLLAGEGWKHVIFSSDLTLGGGSYTQLYLQDADDAASVVLSGGSTIDFTRSNWFFAARDGGSLKCNMEFASVYIAFGQALDLSNSTNRRKFITAGLAPVDLGADGSTPTGTAPTIYLNNSSATFATNLGTGGNFSVTGALTASASGPP